MPINLEELSTIIAANLAGAFITLLHLLSNVNIYLSLVQIYFWKKDKCYIAAHCSSHTTHFNEGPTQYFKKPDSL